MSTAASSRRCVEERVALKKPNEGSFTVETDRGVMMQLEAVACFIKGQLERGVFEVGDIVWSTRRGTRWVVV